MTAKWTVGKTPMAWEGIPAGDYILGEIETPPGYLTSQIEVEIQETSKLQLITMQEDHIKTAFFKYEEKDGKKECLPNAYAAELTLYEAVTDENGLSWKRMEHRAMTGKNGDELEDRRCESLQPRKRQLCSPLSEAVCRISHRV
ncbi:MAG: SpaA isopeptide-forming pilin-related protein [Clostridium fessum]